MLSVTPMLQVQRDLYDLPRGRDRFNHYLATMTGSTDDLVLPLQAMNPMGKVHIVETLDALIALGAENLAAEAIIDAERRLGPVEADLRVGIVVADDVAGGWTNRDLIEANRLRHVPTELLKRGWVVVLFWTSEPVNKQKVREEVLSSVFRDVSLMRHGAPKTLQEVMALEGRALAFAGADEPVLDGEDLAYTREVIRPHLQAAAFEDFPTVFACLFGDDAAKRVGYPPLGLSRRAGFALALAETKERT